MATDDSDTTDPPAPEGEKTVKELIDEATRAELERWFGLPSVQQVEESQPKEPEEDPDVVAVRERRLKAIEAVQPWMLEAHRRRTDPPEDLIKFRQTIDVRVKPDLALLDQAMIDRQATIAEPRSVEIPDQLVDDLKTCTPQSMLRDLHRPEKYFDKQLEVVDPIAELRVDAVAIADEVMKVRYTFEPLPQLPFDEGRALLREVRVDRMRPQSAEQMANYPNRRVTE